MEFYSNTRRPPRMQETYSKQTQAVYKEEFDKKTGKRKLVKTEEINIVDKIQEYAEETKISNLLKKYNYDMIKQIAKNEEQIIDMTNMPENLMETMAVIDNAKYIWERQSKELKAKFNNDFKQFIAGSENGQVAKLLQEELKTQATKFNLEHQANIQPTIKQTLLANQQAELLKAKQEVERLEKLNTTETTIKETPTNV